MRIPVYRLMSAGQNELLRLALIPLERVLGVSWDYQDGAGSDGLNYLCGLPASKLLASHTVVAAPVLRPARYLDLPVYFTDVLTRAMDADLLSEPRGGAIWAYNDRDSFSGWAAVLDGLQRRGVDPAIFHWVRSGSHLNSRSMLCEGTADVSGIDSMIWDSEQPTPGQPVGSMVTVASFGPWPMPPLMASRNLGAEFVSELSQALTVANDDPAVGPVARWADVDDHHLDPIIRVEKTLSDPSLLP